MYHKHYSGKKGKWNFSGEKNYDADSALYYHSEVGSVFGDSCVHYYERTWFYPNGNKRRYIYVDFKKRKKASITDISYSEDGEITDNIFMKAKRQPEQNNPLKIDWEKNE